MATPEQKDRAKKGIKARQDALKTLIERHKEEFEQLVLNNRVALGLPLTPQGPTREELEERLRRQEAQLAKTREQLQRVA